MQVLGLVHQDVPVARRSLLPEQARGLVGQLQVGGLAGGSQLGGDPLNGLPDLAALGLAERPSPAGARAGQVRLLGAQILGQDDLFPLVLAERRGEGQPGLGGGLRPAGAQHPLVRDDGSAAGLLDDAVGQPVHVQHLDPAAHADVADQQVELGRQGVGQVSGEGGHQHRLGAFGQESRTVQYGNRLAGAGAAGHLSRAGVACMVGDLALVRVQERAPRRERVSEDELQFLRQGLVHGHAAGQRVGIRSRCSPARKPFAIARRATGLRPPPASGPWLASPEGHVRPPGTGGDGKERFRGSVGQCTRRTAGCAARNSAIRWLLAQICRIRTPSVLIPRCTSQASFGGGRRGQQAVSVRTPDWCRKSRSTSSRTAVGGSSGRPSPAGECLISMTATWPSSSART